MGVKSNSTFSPVSPFAFGLQKARVRHDMLLVIGRQHCIGWRDIRDVPLERYDAALVCTPDEPKLELLRHLLGNGKHVMVKIAYGPIWVRGKYWGAASIGYILP